MTTLQSAPSKAVHTPKHAVQPVSPQQKAPPPRAPGVAGVGLSLMLLGGLLCGYVFYLFALSPIQEAHMQHNLYATLRGQMQQAIAPLGSPKPGTAVAVMEIPRIGLRAVVVEGTTATVMTRGPGHRRDTPLPGQFGVSEIYGHRTIFGAPFRDLPSLLVGDTIKVTTGQGLATYQVRGFGDGGHPFLDRSPNRLVLITADSSWIPGHWIQVDAQLTSAPQPDPGGRPFVGPGEKALERDDSVLVLTMIWGMALVIAAAIGTALAHSWSRRTTYLALSPVVVAIVWNLYENFSSLQPNVY